MDFRGANDFANQASQHCSGVVPSLMPQSRHDTRHTPTAHRRRTRADRHRRQTSSQATAPNLRARLEAHASAGRMPVLTLQTMLCNVALARAAPRGMVQRLA